MKLSVEQQERVEEILFDPHETGRSLEEGVQTLTTPEELHYFADLFNWDGQVAPLHWVVRQTFCDAGTASLIFWRGEPFEFYKFASREEVNAYDVQIYDLLQEVAQRTVARFYTHQNIRFDPVNDSNDAPEFFEPETLRNLGLAQPIPDQLLRPTPGEPFQLPT